MKYFRCRVVTFSIELDSCKITFCNFLQKDEKRVFSTRNLQKKIDRFEVIKKYVKRNII